MPPFVAAHFICTPAYIACILARGNFWSLVRRGPESLYIENNRNSMRITLHVVTCRLQLALFITQNPIRSLVSKSDFCLVPLRDIQLRQHGAAFLI